MTGGRYVPRASATSMVYRATALGERREIHRLGVPPRSELPSDASASVAQTTAPVASKTARFVTRSLDQLGTSPDGLADLP